MVIHADQRNLEGFKAAFASPNAGFGITFGSSYQIISGPASFLWSGYGDEPLKVIRHAPIIHDDPWLGYVIDDVTQTIDRLDGIRNIGIHDYGYTVHSQHTIRIYGHPIPEPSALVLAVLSAIGFVRLRPISAQSTRSATA
jgi:hypothetical protein